MSSYNITREDMIEPVERMYEREYGGEHGMFHTLEDETEGGEGNVDLIYVQGDSRHLHVIRLESSYDSCMFNTKRGLFSLRDVAANFRWISLPLYEFREGEDAWNNRMKSECESRGIGIITAQKKGRGVSAKVILEPEQQEGDFLDQYGELSEVWEAQRMGEDAPEGFRVVDYYKR